MSVATEIERIQRSKEDVRRALQGIGINIIERNNNISLYSLNIRQFGKAENLTFEAVESGTFGIEKVGSPGTNTIYYRKNDSAASSLVAGRTYSFAEGDKFEVFGSGTGLSKDSSNYWHFVITGRMVAYGDVCSLFKNRTPATNSTGKLCCLFKDCTSLISLPYKSLVISANPTMNFCSEMFSGCTSLENAPVLPSMELANGCYAGMFRGCTSLEESPILHSGELRTDCYKEMFSGCTSLKKVTMLYYIGSAMPAQATASWLSGVSQTGTFVKSQYDNTKEETYRTAFGIPDGWTIENDIVG